MPTLVSRSLAAGLLAALAALPAAGCQLDLSYVGASFRCEVPCAEGEVCVDGACVAGAAGDGGGDRDDAPDACASASSLTDGFDEPGLPGWSTWADEGAAVDAIDGDLVFALGTEVAYAEAISAHALDLRHGAFEIEVGEVSTSQFGLHALVPRDETSASLELHDGILMHLLSPAGPGGADVSTPYDPELHRFWRLAGSDGRLRWETSPDRVAWTLHRDEAMPAAFRMAHAYLWAYGAPTPGEAHVAAVNPDPAPADWCSADDLADAFDGEVLGPQWRVHQDPTCAVGVLDGRLDFALDGDDVWCAVEALRPIDLRAAPLSFELEVPVASAFVRLGTADEVLHLDVTPAGVWLWRGNVLLVDGRPVADARWWRIVAEGDDVTYAVSADGADWIDVARVGGVTGLDAVAFDLGASGDAVAGHITLDSVNVAP